MVPYSAEAMFDLVADVERYPEFLPWCSGAWIRDQDPGRGVVEATLEVRRGPLRKSFTTRNRLEPGRAIRLDLVEGPLRALRGQWRFDPIGDDGCRVELELAFDVGGGVLGKALGPVFGEIADTMVDAFCRRASRIYGAAHG